ncbi:MAG: ChaN family lipoprotein [Armatimonadetes bacterium]|nr:ChaN family lipoprotein [Armatimonadota bacterium]
MPLFPVAIVQSDPYLLDIGTKGQVEVKPGFTDTATGKRASVKDVVNAAKGVRFVFVGESHNNPEHHTVQAQVIEALVKDGRKVCVGMEMFTRDNQGNLGAFPLGWWSDEEFQARSDWKKQWGFPYRIYKPVFDAVKKHRLPLVALNVPRDWVRQVSRQGPSSLTDVQKKWVPDLDLGNQEHRSVFDALVGGHAGSGADGMYAGQVTWDTAMANTALEFLGEKGAPDRVMVIVVGSGHMMYGQGINWRISKRTGERTLNVTCIDSEGPRQVSKGLGDFVYVAAPVKE